ncbi:type II toxin-antitoxin system RelE/ParE family toxin [Pseudomonas sp. App30]|uniref:type II toxin-antitoxin system RelE/ParE family toxin n=1 Tax=Pseudomonas sp. App30 TaxID=3068990 RepID=UPI003A810F40
MNYTRVYKTPFRQFVKKAHRALGLAIDMAVDCICDEPYSGTEKTGDLSGIRVYKFKFHRQEYLIAYRLMPSTDKRSASQVELLSIEFYQVGTHENFYDMLKSYLKH